MKIEKLHVADKQFDLNLKFYFFLKYLVKTNLSDNQVHTILTKLLGCKMDYVLSKNELHAFIEGMKAKSKVEAFSLLVDRITDALDLRLFVFSLKLYAIKDLLLSEAKLRSVVDIETLASLHPLSLKYDEKTLYSPYAKRVNGALLALLFFSKLESGEVNVMSSDALDFMQRLSQEAIALKGFGLEPNQIFMLMFSESINQSITSDSGSNYEDRILTVLTQIGIPKDSISKIHDAADSSTEFDFFFELQGRSYGIGAKRTLRERYKQFIKTAATSHIDVMIEITLGDDLNEATARTILNHGTILFVADEIYQARDFLQRLDGVYSVVDLTRDTLLAL